MRLQNFKNIEGTTFRVLLSKDLDQDPNRNRDRDRGAASAILKPSPKADLAPRAVRRASREADRRANLAALPRGRDPGPNRGNPPKTHGAVTRLARRNR